MTRLTLRTRPRAREVTTKVRISLLALALCATGCTTTARYVSPSLEHTPSLWTVVSVRGAGDVSPELQQVVNRAALAELEGSQRFLPLALPPEATQELIEASVDWQRGPPADRLVSLSRSWGADAVALVSVRRFDPYPPMRLILSLEVHSTDTGALLFASSYEAQEGNTWRPARTLSRERFAREACAELLHEVP